MTKMPALSSPVPERKATARSGMSRPAQVMVALGLVVCLTSLALFASLAVPLWAQSAQQASPLVPAADPGVEPAGRASIDNVFIIVVDGARNKEMFEHPTHMYIPRIWNDLRPMGTIYNDFITLGQTATSAGHAAMTTGVTQFFPNNLQLGTTEIDTLQDDPSIFQYYRSQLGASKSKTWIINGKGKMIHNVGICHHPLYGDDYEPYVSFSDKATDDQTYNEVVRVIDTYHPSMTLINLRDVDEYGHAGNWNDYVNSIVHADTIVYNICQKIWNDPYYDNNTAIFITTDHGRHLEGISTSWRDHGCSCQGCRRIPFLAIGPGIKTNHVVYEDEAHLRDLAPTIAYMMGFEARFSEGRILREMLVSPPAKEANAMNYPSVAYDGGKIHVAVCRQIGRDSQIIYANSSDNGKTWRDATILSAGKQTAIQPAIFADDDRVTVTWSEYYSDGKYKASARVSTNGGGSFGKKMVLPGAVPWQEDLYLDVTQNGFWVWTNSYVVWTEMSYTKGYLNIAELRNSYVGDSATFTSNIMEHPRCAADSDNVHVVYQEIDAAQKNWDIWYCRYDGNNWGTAQKICDTDDDSTRPDVAYDSNGVHVVWAEENNGKYEIRYRKSTDGGNSWGSTDVLSSSSYGAWRPRISSGNGTLAVVWEGVRNSVSAVYRVKSTNGGYSWSSADRLSSTSSGDSAHPDVIVDDNEVLHAFWNNGPWPTSIDFTDQQL